MAGAGTRLKDYRRALELTNGVQAEAARHLEISRSDLGYKVAKYAITLVPRANID